MTEPSRSSSSEGLSSEGGIPSGLNRIKTRQVSLKDPLSSKPDELVESKTYGATTSRPPVKGKQKQMAQGRGKSASSKAGSIPLFFAVDFFY